jgi:hypothetical protein
MTRNPFVEKAANVLAKTRFETAQAPDPHRAMAHRLEEAGLLNRPVATVWAPLPVRARRKGLMVELDVTSLVRSLFVAHADRSAEDAEGVAEELAKVSALSDTVRSQHTFDAREAAEVPRNEKVRDLLDEIGGATQLLTRDNAYELGMLLIELAGARVPRQDHGHGAAA